jgi:hypothetical protein
MYTPLQVHQHPYHGERLYKHPGQYLTFGPALMVQCRGCRRIQSGMVMVCYTTTVQFAAKSCVWIHSPQLDSSATHGIHLLLRKCPNSVGKEDDDGGSEIRGVRNVHIFHNRTTLPFRAPVLLHQALCLANGSCKVIVVRKRDVHDVVEKLVRRHIEIIVEDSLETRRVSAHGCNVYDVIPTSGAVPSRMME